MDGTERIDNAGLLSGTRSDVGFDEPLNEAEASCTPLERGPQYLCRHIDTSPGIDESFIGHGRSAGAKSKEALRSLLRAVSGAPALTTA